MPVGSANDLESQEMVFSTPNASLTSVRKASKSNDFQSRLVLVVKTYTGNENVMTKVIK